MNNLRLRVRDLIDRCFLAIAVFLLLACAPSDINVLIDTDESGDIDTGVAIFAGGCFWCTEADFDKLPGVISTTPGYIGGDEKNPTYKQVSAGKTGHVEAVQVLFDRSKTSFATLLVAYWLTIDPLTPDRQFCDVGAQYRSVIFYHDDSQLHLINQSKAELEASGRFSEPIVTEVRSATAFYPAEDYHQDYYLKNPIRYQYYRNNCERDQRLEQLWGDREIIKP